MTTPHRGRRRIVLLTTAIAAAGGLVATTPAIGMPIHHRHMTSGGMHAQVNGGGDDGGGEESDSIQEGADQRTEERMSPGVVNPGAYGAAWASMQNLPRTGGDWRQVTKLPYNSDDPRYRDYNSNSTAGMGNVTGRASAVVADNHGNVYAGAAGGGVWRSTTGGGDWKSISDQLPAQATGALALDGKGRLWLGTGEATTNADAYLGAGVYMLDDPAHSRFSPHDRIGGDELQSSSIHELRISGDKIWAATTEGLWSHSITNLRGPWKLEFAPNPDYLPGHSKAGDPNAAYENIVSDVAFDPADPSHVLAAVGWRSGTLANGSNYNGYYSNTGGTWQLVTSGMGDLPTDAGDVGAVTFAASADHQRYYAITESPASLAAGGGLGGIYVSKSGSPFGPWTLIADAAKLAASGSALSNVGGQSWYDESLTVDPNNHDHVYAGLEEVFQTTDGGATWTTPGIYWNFPLACWSLDPNAQSGTCSQTTHPDQHGLAIGSLNGQSYVVAANDGGLYKRPVNGQADSLGHATDWTSLNDGTIDTLQYYSVGVGTDPAGKGVVVTGGLQDNGQSVLRGYGSKAVDTVMGSNFGGDGGMTLVDPKNGCNEAQEYVYLEINVTQNCAVNNGLGAPTTYDVPPPDQANSAARFIAPFSADQLNPNTWVAGGQHVWVENQGFGIRSSSQWTSAFDLGAGHVATAVASSGGKVYAAWCGPCNSQGFTHGVAVGNADGTGWSQLTLPANLPNRYISDLTIDPADSSHVYMTFSGFSREWNEGPGAGIGHVFESHDSGATWTDISANLPDVPVNSLSLTPQGGLLVGTDLGAVYRAPGRTKWRAIAELPAVSVDQILLGPDGRVYAATHGRGIYAIELRDLGRD
ncbi:glycosyl hydrolase [Streptacidiphilus jiangxiensis]|uniref:glycosyl hydrolase n=1 Tax=Streptacidiphilus jiangxiensis TaxID=235985 RepID=UPI0005A7E243|nr:glycosyl hydrolase [Streptacidiphilus jiangxiensis]